MDPLGDDGMVTNVPSEPPLSPRDTGAPAEAGGSRGIAAMFDRIADVYDPMNAIISGFQEPRWRRRCVTLAALHPGMAAIDVATGTGNVAGSLHAIVGPGGHVLGVDAAPRMVQRAIRQHGERPGLAFVVGDALALPADDASFDAATIAFGMRNLPDHDRAFAEMARVVRPGGRVVCLEIARPSGLHARAARLWFERAVPLLGRAAGHGDAYAYLVRSVRAYPPPARIAAIMRAAGLEDVRWEPMSLGMVTLHVGHRKAPDSISPHP
jgi:demethylmenaquinone methyltransferase / 2-methoxy-6-polyprenyl-1,4-benzoquinol methylase